jgi:ABC-type branched-subunit amino acid transport system substrate-binding protein
MPDRFTLDVLVEVVVELKWTNVSLLYSEGTYGESGAKYLERLAKDNNICIGFSHRIPSDADDGNFDRVVLDLYKEKARVVFLWCEVGHQHSLAQSLEKMELANSFVFLAGDGLTLGGTVAISSIKINHPQLSVPGFAEYVAKIEPWDHHTNPWLPITWTEYFGCTWGNSNHAVTIE